mmetsp:Transcript_36788/g.80529  ORF Transcript_36788/g.80529 Transcript_36788/m.80529 type:complete len:120 (+) Transcript_36788:820-1179(+)
MRRLSILPSLSIVRHIYPSPSSSPPCVKLQKVRNDASKSSFDIIERVVVLTLGCSDAPLVDFHNPPTLYSRTKRMQRSHSLLPELLWEPRHFGGVISGTGYDSKALAPGLGSLLQTPVL